jgi:maltose O-acetyltransferase
MFSVRDLLIKVYEKYFQPNELEPLIKRGLKVGKNLNMQSEVIIDSNHCWHITIGDDVILAPRVMILAHDASTKRFLNHTRIGKVSIGNRVFIGASSVILPGVTIGNDVIVGAGSVVTIDIPDGVVAAGNPAKVLMSLSDFLAKRQKEMDLYPVFGPQYKVENKVSEAMRLEMNDKMNAGKGYIV